MPQITKCSTITGFPVWLKRCISATYEIVMSKMLNLGQAAHSPDKSIRSAARQVFDLAPLPRLSSLNIVRTLASVIIAVHRPEPPSQKESHPPVSAAMEPG